MTFISFNGCRWSLLILTIFASFAKPTLAQENLSPAEFVSTALRRHPSIVKANEAVASAEFGW